jgi:hypothetical protein
MVFERIDTVEDPVVKGLLPEIVPEMFNGIELDFEEDVGEFFPDFLSGHIGLRVSLVGCQLSPAMTV